MKKIIFTMLFLMGSLFANSVGQSFKHIIATNDFVSKDTQHFTKERANKGKIAYKEGFLTSKECMQQGVFKDCQLESYSRSDMVLYVHDENRAYTINMNNDITLSTYEHAINRNGVKYFGTIDDQAGVIHVAGLSVPPKPKTTFFKGCL